MKILFVHNYYPLQASGEDSVMDEERRMLEEAGHEVLLFFMTTREGGLVNLLYCGLCALWNPVAYHRIRRLLRDKHPDVVHCHNTFPLISPSVYWACKHEDVPVVQTLHNFRLVCANGLFLRDRAVCEMCSGKFFPWPALRYRCYRGSFAGSLTAVLMLWTHRILGTWKCKVDRYIVLTEFARQRFVESGVLPTAKLTVKPNFVKCVNCQPDEEQGTTPKVYSLFVGRLSIEKGVDVLVDAWMSAAARKPGLFSNVELLVVGDGPEQLYLKEKVNTRISASDGVTSSIRFLGHLPRERVVHIMRGASFLILPSIWYEGFPMTIVESFSCGTPILASALGNMKSIIQEGETGLFFKPGDAESLSEKIIWALTHQSTMARMGIRARQVFDSNYTPEQNRGQLIDVYRSVSDQ